MKVREIYKLQNYSENFRVSSSLKDLQCIAVCTVEECSETKSVMPLTHRIGRLQSHHTPSTNDEPCRQSYAARGRPRLSYREHHWSAPVKLTAAQSGPWHRPANYRPSRIEAATHVVDPDKGHTKEAQKNKRIQNQLSKRPRQGGKVKSARKAKPKNGP